MRRDRARGVAGLLAALLFLGACGSGGATAALEPARTPDGAPTFASPGDTAAPSPPSAVGTLPPGALNIATLGDSLTEGQGDDSGLGGYPGRLEKLIEPLRPGTRIVNVGHSGWTSADLIGGQNGQPSELTEAIGSKPNVALVWIGSNDLWYLYEGGPEPMTTEAERADLALYEVNIDRILQGLTSHGTTVFIALLDDQSKRPVVARPNPTEPAFSEITPADLALMSAHIRAYNDIIGRKAAQYGAGTVDFYRTTIFTDAATLYGDGNHPNEAGYDRIAGIWFAALQPRLK